MPRISETPQRHATPRHVAPRHATPRHATPRRRRTRPQTPRSARPAFVFTATEPTDPRRTAGTSARQTAPISRTPADRLRRYLRCDTQIRSGAYLTCCRLAGSTRISRALAADARVKTRVLRRPGVIHGVSVTRVGPVRETNTGRM